MAKKKSHEEEIRRGGVALRQKGLAIDEASPALASRLKEQFGQGRETDLAIIFTLGKIADPAAVEADVHAGYISRDYALEHYPQYRPRDAGKEV